MRGLYTAGAGLLPTALKNDPALHGNTGSFSFAARQER
jgi:hypothetical protein